MKSRTAASFWRAHATLPHDVQKQAKRAYQLWLANPSHPSLQFELKLRLKPPVYSVRIIGTGYRALCFVQGDTASWFWIGTHDEYKRISRSF